MKNIIRIAVLLAVTALSSCSGGQPDPAPNLDAAEIPAIELENLPENFYGHLANEYINLAAYERDFMGHEDDALDFTAKARRTLREQDVEPDVPDSRDIPDFAYDELVDARAMLMDALETLRIPSNEALLAMAQTRYDCWLTHREDFPQEDAWISCKNEFYDTLALLTLPEGEDIVYSVYFNQGEAAMDEAARKIAAAIAERYRDRDQWYVVLQGYTDGKGGKNENKVLSMRRAIAVKNMLGQYGINLDNIAISAEGEIVKDGEDRASRRVDIEVRPHYIAQDKHGLTVLSGWNHSGEF